MASKSKKRTKVSQSQRLLKGAPSVPHRLKRPKRNASSRSSIPQATAVNPFEASDDVLLVGEGDFSFAASLKLHHSSRFATLTATSFDTREELLAKHPQAEKHVQLLVSSTPASHEGSESSTSPARRHSGPHRQDCTVHYSVDAKKLSIHGRLKIRRYSKIVFNFPHVGGKSTDVNRQVRYNQELVHGFLHSCKAILAKDGSILITLFEGEPYSLWNIRDLARSAGLIVKRSFPFDSRLYPGYKHARTLGNLKRPSFGDEFEHTKGLIKKKTGWKGEDRTSRTFEFAFEDGLRHGNNQKRKKGFDDNSTSSDED